MLPILSYYLCLNDFLNNKKFNEVEYFTDFKFAKIQIFTFSIIINNYNLKHYRHKTLKEELIHNLKNVYVPYTGITYSFFCRNIYLVYIFLFLVYPFMTCFGRGLLNHLSDPNDLFSIWRINSMINYYHWIQSDKKLKLQYKHENKMYFTKNAEENKLPVAPYLKLPSIIIKHVNREGGLAIYKFSNSFNGGDWLIQEDLKNHNSLLSLLPENPPLSTFRVVTINNGNPLLCVWRYGYSNSKTDHESSLYSINLNTGVIVKKIENDFCYSSFFKEKKINIDKKIIGKKFNIINDIKKLAEKSHKVLIPDIPIAGWDIAYTEKHGLVLLEVNLSCNLHSNFFNKKTYFDYINNMF